MKANPICIKCGVKLTDDNWYPSRRWQNSRICKECNREWNSISWAFNIGRNTTADYFLCLAFDNREDLNPLHAWLIPGSKINHLTGTSISPSTLHKWDAYALDTSKIGDCCDAMR